MEIILTYVCPCNLTIESLVSNASAKQFLQMSMMMGYRMAMGCLMAMGYRMAMEYVTHKSTVWAEILLFVSYLPASVAID